MILTVFTKSGWFDIHEFDHNEAHISNNELKLNQINLYIKLDKIFRMELFVFGERTVIYEH